MHLSVPTQKKLFQWWPIL